MAYYPNSQYNFTGYPQTPVVPTYTPPITTPVQQTNTILTVVIGSDYNVAMHPVAAGETVAFVNFNAGKFYLKSTGKDGVPQPIREFSLTEDAPVPAQNQNESRYVTVDQLDALSNKLNDLIERLGGEK